MPEKSSINISVGGQLLEENSQKLVVKQQDLRRGSDGGNLANQTVHIEIGNSPTNPQRYEKYFIDRNRVSEAKPTMDYKDMRLKNSMKVGIPFSEKVSIEHHKKAGDSPNSSALGI